MRPVSSNFLSTIRGSHLATFRVRVVESGQTGVTPVGTELEVESGMVFFDTRAEVNGTVNLIAVLPWPDNSSGLGTPYGQELYIERGVEYGSGTREWVGLGYFRIDSIEQVGSDQALVRILGSDRMANVRDARPLEPKVYTAGTSVAAIVTDVLEDSGVSPVMNFDWDANSELLVTDHVLSEDKIKFLHELLTSYGKVFYFDYGGEFTAKTQPTSANDPVFSVNAGRNGVLVSMNRYLSRDGVYNAVVATGESIGDAPPVRAVAYDNDPSSPTYFFGPFGRVPRFFSSSFMTTTDQCQDAANSILAQSIGLPYVVEFGVVPNPALEGWDVIDVLYSDRSAPETHIIDSIGYSLSVDGEMTLTSRKQFLE